MQYYSLHLRCLFFVILLGALLSSAMPTHNESFSFAGTAANTKNTTTTGLRQLQDEFVDLMMKQSPISATMFGLNPYPDSVANYSLAAHQDAKSKLEKLKEYAATVVPKEDDDAEMGDLEFLKTAINLGISAFSGYKYELPASHLTGPITDLALEFSRQASSANDWESGDGHGKLITPPFKYTPLSSLFSLKSYQKLDSKQDLKHYKTRLFKVKPMFEEIVVAFQVTLSRDEGDVISMFLIRSTGLHQRQESQRESLFQLNLLKV